MKIKEISLIIKDLYVFQPEIYRDFRGENIETYNTDVYSETLLAIDEFKINKLKFSVDSFSFSRKNVLRGFHGDTKAWKLIQCVQGSIYFVVVDLRKDSPTYKAVQTLILDDKSRQQVLVPRGCVNAHLCLTDTCIFNYKLTHGYVKQEDQITLKWNDSKFNIYWPIADPILSLRDK